MNLTTLLLIFSMVGSVAADSWRAKESTGSNGNIVPSSVGQEHPLSSLRGTRDTAADLPASNANSMLAHDAMADLVQTVDGFHRRLSEMDENEKLGSCFPVKDCKCRSDKDCKDKKCDDEKMCEDKKKCDDNKDCKEKIIRDITLANCRIQPGYKSWRQVGEKGRGGEQDKRSGGDRVDDDDDEEKCFNFGGKVNGDPHFSTWSGEKYDFHGQCDLVLVRNHGFADGLGMDIHIRTKIHNDWSAVESAAIKVGDDVFEISGRAGHWLNGVADHELPALLGRFEVSLGNPGPNTRRFVVHLGDGQKIRITTFKEFLSIFIDDP
jgi:hypothetical protein